MRHARDTPATLVVVDQRGSETVVAHLDDACPELILIDVLARVHVAARRGGLRLMLRDATPRLREMIELCGLGCVLALEARGQPECLEDLWVEEVMEPRDPPV